MAVSTAAAAIIVVIVVVVDVIIIVLVLFVAVPGVLGYLHIIGEDDADVDVGAEPALDGEDVGGVVGGDLEDLVDDVACGELLEVEDGLVELVAEDPG